MGEPLQGVQWALLLEGCGSPQQGVQWALLEVGLGCTKQGVQNCVMVQQAIIAQCSFVTIATRKF